MSDDFLVRLKKKAIESLKSNCNGRNYIHELGGGNVILDGTFDIDELAKDIAKFVLEEIGV